MSQQPPANAKHLSDFSGHHSGPCFVCGTGPSLKQLTSKLWKAYPAIGVNHIEDQAFSDGVPFIPDYLVVVDRLHARHDYGKELNRKNQAIFNSSASYIFTKYALNENGCGLAQDRQIKVDLEPILDNDPNHTVLYNKLHACCTSTVPAISLAMLMGFKQIGLIGFDLYGHGLMKSLNNVNKGCARLNDFAKSLGIEIINLSEHSAVNSFPKHSVAKYVKWYPPEEE